MKLIYSKLWIPAAILLVIGAALVYGVGYSILLPTSNVGSHRPPSAASVSESVSVPGNGAGAGDALLLYDPKRSQTVNEGFRRVIEFYGLELAELDVTQVVLSDKLLRDSGGAYYSTVFISGAILADLSTEDMQLIKNAVDRGGMNLQVGAVHADNPILEALTAGEVTGATPPKGTSITYHVTSTWPEITRELSGVDVLSEHPRPSNAILIASHTPSIQSLINATDLSGRTYSVFAIYTKGSGHIFISGNDPDSALSNSPLASNYYTVNHGDRTFQADRFAQLVPMMMFVRYTAGDRAWHAPHNYANFTLDDPALNSSQFNFSGMLQEAIDHNFHFTLAMPPMAYQKAEPAVVGLFLQNPDYLSVTQHGNNHDGYEFYEYTTEASDPRPARPKVDQEADIAEGLTRMEALKSATGLSFARVMIFPENISPADTLPLLQEYGFEATANSRDFPLDVERDNTWDSYMYPAELNYGDLPVLRRDGPRSAPYPFDLFLGKPLLLYGHKDFFSGNIGALNPVADYINGLQGRVEWRSLDYILKHLYMEKSRSDGSVDIKFYSADVVISNETDSDHLYRIRRNEAGSVPISRVTVDGLDTDYNVADGYLSLEVEIATGASAEVRIKYASPERDFSFDPGDLRYDAQSGVVSATVHNVGTNPGPAPVGFFAGPPDGGQLITISTASDLQVGASQVVTASLANLPPDGLSAVIDPYGILNDTDRSNNEATLDGK